MVILSMIKISNSSSSKESSLNYSLQPSEKVCSVWLRLQCLTWVGSKPHTQTLRDVSLWNNWCFSSGLVCVCVTPALQGHSQNKFIRRPQSAEFQGGYLCHRTGNTLDTEVAFQQDDFSSLLFPTPQSGLSTLVMNKSRSLHSYTL